MRNQVNDYLEELQKRETASVVPADIQSDIGRLIAHCNQHYADQGFYGNAALNRLVLLDPFVAEILSKENVIAFLMHNENYFVTRVTAGNRNIRIPFRDVLKYGFKDGLDVIAFMPNNEEPYGKEKYDEQKLKFKNNTLRIVEAMENALKVPQENRTQINPMPSPTYEELKQITNTIDKVKEKSKTGSEELLRVPGWTKEQIQNQMQGSFLKICNKLELKTSEVTVMEFCEKFLSNDTLLLDGEISHLFYDRLHLTAALESTVNIAFRDNERANLRMVFYKMIEIISKNPGKYKVAEEQLSTRLKLVFHELEEKFKSETTTTKDRDLLSTSKKADRLDEDGKRLLEQGPLPKSIYTVQLEKIIERLLFNEKVKAYKVHNKIFISFENTSEIFNLSDLVKNANFQHIKISDEALGRYDAFLKKFLNKDRIKIFSQEEVNTILGEKETHRFTTADAMAVSFYTCDTGYNLINGFMRTQNSQTTEMALDAAVHSCVLAQALTKLSNNPNTVGRNESLENGKTKTAERYFSCYGENFSAKAGSQSIIKATGFLSTTGNIDDKVKAEDKFANAKSKNHLMRFYYAKPGPSVKSFSELADEDELLMFPGQLQVLSTHYDKKSMRTIVDVRLISDLAEYSPQFLDAYTKEKDLDVLQNKHIQTLFAELSSEDVFIKNIAHHLIYCSDFFKDFLSNQDFHDFYEEIGNLLSEYKKSNISKENFLYQFFDLLKFSEQSTEKNPSEETKFIIAVMKNDIDYLKDNLHAFDFKKNKEFFDVLLLIAFDFNKDDVFSLLLQQKKSEGSTNFFESTIFRFDYLFQNFTPSSLKIFLDSDVLSIQDLLVFFKEKNPFSMLPKDPHVIFMLSVHEKTNHFFSKGWYPEGDFISVFSSNIQCLSAGLQAKFYSTEAGIAVLQKSLLKEEISENAKEIIKAKLLSLDKPFREETANVSLLSHKSLNCEQMYKALTHFVSNKTWFYQIFDDQGKEIGRLICPYESKDNKPHVVYYPGTDSNNNPEGRSLEEIKKQVDAEIKINHPEINLASSIRHYLLITGNNEYVAGVSDGASLDIHGTGLKQKIKSYDAFQKITGCSTREYHSTPNKEFNTSFGPLLSHADLLLNSKNIDKVNFSMDKTSASSITLSRQLARELCDKEKKFFFFANQDQGVLSTKIDDAGVRPKH